MTTRAAIYARISSDQENRRRGVKDQEEDGRDICEEKGYRIHDVYIDNNRTAADPTKPRPEYDRLMSDVRAGLIDVVVVTIVDRLYRQPVELETFFTDALRAGMTQVSTMRGDYDLSNEERRYDLRDEVNRAGREVAVIRRRVKRRHQQRADDGLPNGGSRPFGFKHDRITHNPDEAELIREAVKHVLSTGSINSVVRDWNERGVKTVATTEHDRYLAGERDTDRTPTTWSQSQLSKLLRSPRIAGLRKHGADTHEATWEPIIGIETWERLQVVLDNPERRWVRSDHTFPLIGILHCASCRRPLGQIRRTRGSEYGCRWKGCTSKTNVDAAAVDKYVLGVLLPLCDSPAMRRAVAHEIGESAKEAQTLVSANATDEAKVSQLADLLADGSLDPASYAKATKKLRAAIEERQAKLVTLRSGSVLDLLGGSVADRWDTLSQADRVAILRVFVSAVYVRRSPTRRGRVHGGGPFDKDRVNFVLNLGTWAEASQGLWEAMTEEEREAEYERHLASLTDEERFAEPA